ncbi:MAG: hypothetical protein R3C49_01720 [Planctomycetaceae bacterium]
MMIEVHCECGKVLRAKPELAGRRVKCPNCQAVLSIPQAAGGSSKPAGASTAKSDAQAAARPQTSAQPKPAAKPAAAAVPGKKRPQSSGGGQTRPQGKPAVKKRTPPPQDDFYSADDFEEIDDDLDDFGGDDFAADSYAPALPSRKKKKKSNSKTSAKSKSADSDSDEAPAISPKVMYSLYALAGTVSAVIMFFVVRGLMSAGAEEAEYQALPQNFAVFKHDQLGLSSEYPDAKGWEKSSGGGTGGVPPWATFKSERQGVTITIRGSASGTAISDIAAAGGGMAGGILGDALPDELHPAAAAHAFQKDKISADYNSYEETEPQKIETGFGEGRVSDFVGSGALSSEYGIRATVISNQYQYNIICKVPKKRLEEYRPVFERIIKSVGG